MVGLDAGLPKPLIGREEWVKAELGSRFGAFVRELVWFWVFAMGSGGGIPNPKVIHVRNLPQPMATDRAEFRAPIPLG